MPLQDVGKGFVSVCAPTSTNVQSEKSKKPLTSNATNVNRKNVQKLLMSLATNVAEMNRNNRCQRLQLSKATKEKVRKFESNEGREMLTANTSRRSFLIFLSTVSVCSKLRNKILLRVELNMSWIELLALHLFFRTVRNRIQILGF